MQQIESALAVALCARTRLAAQVPFVEETPIALIEAIRPELLVKRADYTKDKVVGAGFVESHGGEVALAPLIDGRSTSNVIERILESYGQPR